ncbi:MAG: DUF1425 domain-containing protein [Planctomycetota bacterium]|nr:DUF1425 domain-containing protein [Planctomycetota bacterium]
MSPVRVSLVTPAAALLLCCLGCFGGSEPLVISTPRKGWLLADERLRIEDVATTVVGDELRLSIVVANVADADVEFDFAAKWLDEDEKPAAPIAWTEAKLKPGETATLESAAPAEHAVHYELLVRLK